MAVEKGNGNGVVMKAMLALAIAFVLCGIALYAQASAREARVVALERDRDEWRAEIHDLRGDIKELRSAVFEALNGGAKK